MSDVVIPPFVPPLPKLAGARNLLAAVHHEADFQITRRHQGASWTRDKHLEWMRLAWAAIHAGAVS